MAGGLLNLIALGHANLFLNGNPCKTFFSIPMLPILPNLYPTPRMPPTRVSAPRWYQLSSEPLSGQLEYLEGL